MLPHAGFSQPQFEGPELARERNLLVLAEWLPAPYQHRMAVHRRFDRAHGLGGERAAQINATRFGGEQRVKRSELKGHGNLKCYPSGRPGTLFAVKRPLASPDVIRHSFI